MSDFLQQYNGYLSGVMQWQDLSKLWETIRNNPQPWYVYAVGDDVPETPVNSEQLDAFIDSIDHLLRQEHDQDYCGIVYTDSPDSPSLVKIYDPNNLGVVCGFSEQPPLPGWVLSRQPPIDLPGTFPPTVQRKRWWSRIFS